MEIDYYSLLKKYMLQYVSLFSVQSQKKLKSYKILLENLTKAFKKVFLCCDKYIYSIYYEKLRIAESILITGKCLTI